MTASPSVDYSRLRRSDMNPAKPADTSIVLDAEAWEQWEELNRRPARDLPRLREFMQRPAPVFDD